MNIYEKINEVMKRIEYLTKDDHVSFGTTNYKAISEEKVTTSVRKRTCKSRHSNCTDRTNNECYGTYENRKSS